MCCSLELGTLLEGHTVLEDDTVPGVGIGFELGTALGDRKIVLVVGTVPVASTAPGEDIAPVAGTVLVGTVLEEDIALVVDTALEEHTVPAAGIDLGGHTGLVAGIVHLGRTALGVGIVLEDYFAAAG